MNPYYEVDKKAIVDILDQKLSHNRERIAFHRFFDSVVIKYGDPANNKRVTDLFDMLMDEQAHPAHVITLMFCFMITPTKLKRMPNCERVTNYIGHKAANNDFSVRQAARPSTEALKTLDHLLSDPVETDAGVSLDTLSKLQALCEEHEGWIERMLRTKNFDPKNHPTPASLRERDTIRLKIQAVATPEVILELVKIAKKERGVV